MYECAASSKRRKQYMWADGLYSETTGCYWTMLDEFGSTERLQDTAEEICGFLFVSVSVPLLLFLWCLSVGSVIFKALWIFCRYEMCLLDKLAFHPLTFLNVFNYICVDSAQISQRSCSENLISPHVFVYYSKGLVSKSANITYIYTLRHF